MTLTIYDYVIFTVILFLFFRYHKEDFSIMKALSFLRHRMKEDSSIARTWHDNIAVCAKDEGVEDEAAQRIASRFMTLAFGVKTNGNADHVSES